MIETTEFYISIQVHLRSRPCFMQSAVSMARLGRLTENGRPNCLVDTRKVTQLNLFLKGGVKTAYLKNESKEKNQTNK